MPPRMLLLLAGLAALIALIQVNLLAIAFDKLGLSPHAAMTLVLFALFGSAINLPLVRITARRRRNPRRPCPPGCNRCRFRSRARP